VEKNAKDTKLLRTKEKNALEKTDTKRKNRFFF